jgi:hypothetical protein
MLLYSHFSHTRFFIVSAEILLTWRYTAINQFISGPIKQSINIHCDLTLAWFIHNSIDTCITWNVLWLISGGYFNAHIPPYIEWLKYFSIIHYTYTSLHILCTEDVSILWYVAYNYMSKKYNMIYKVVLNLPLGFDICMY